MQAAGDPGNVDIFGDLRCLRKDILLKGVASREWAARCKILTGFPPGTPIDLQQEHIGTIVEELAAWVRSLGGTPRGSIGPGEKGRHRT